MASTYHLVIESDSNPDQSKYSGVFEGLSNDKWFSAAKASKNIFLPLKDWNNPTKASATKDKIERPSRTRAVSFSQHLSEISTTINSSTPGIIRRRSSLSGDPRPVDPDTHIARTRKDLSGPKPGSKEYYDIHTSPDSRFGKIEVSGLDIMESASSVSEIGNSNESFTTKEVENVETSTISTTPTSSVPTLKSTFMGYGVIRLYRDLDEGNDQIVDTDDGTVIAILAVPGYMSTTDLLQYLGQDTIKNSSHIRLISSNGTPNRYMVLIKFRDIKFATEFYLAYNGKVFNSMEAETCHAVYVKSVQFRSHIHKSEGDIPYLIRDPFTGVAGGGSSSFPTKTSNAGTSSTNTTTLQELPTCPVCLDRMDATITGLLTILCQHTFHCQCLQKWGDSSCPVCRHTTPNTGLTDLPISTSTKCYVCDAGSNLWTCLICGHVGCGRYDKAHAYDHYVATGHCFSMDITTQRVWDYASDGYVHRLIQNQSDGKLVELPSGSSSSISDTNKKDIEKDLSLQYTYLLTSQLESQRDYYEGLLANAEERSSHVSDSVNSRLNSLTKLVEQQQIENKRLVETCKTFETNFETVKQQAFDIKKSYIEEKVLSDKMILKLEQVIKENEEKDKTINDLNEQIRDLMFFLDAKEKLANADEDIQQGTVSIPQSSSSSKKKVKRKSKK